jgi:hypothetical protein
MGVYLIFVDEDDMFLEMTDYDDNMWPMHFDDACSNKGNEACIIFFSLVGKIHNFSYRL